MKIKIHRGTNQIGGCVTEIMSKNARIIIDVGTELPGKDNSIGTTVNINEVTKGCDGVLITHYHGDHIGEYKDIYDGVPTYIGKQAKEIFLIWQEELLKIPEVTDVTGAVIKKIKDFIPVNQGEPFVIKDMTITPIRTDHSAFDSYMYLIEADGERILHTGDFRTHGAVGKGTPKALKSIVAKDKLDVLIIEGTMLARPDENVISEFKLQEKATILIKQKKYIFILCSSTNIDRIAAFYHANKSAGKRVFVHDDFQDKMLKYVTKTSAPFTSYYDFSDVVNYNDDIYDRMVKDGFCMLLRRSMLVGNYGLAKFLYSSKFKDNIFIYSQWKGYLKGVNKDKDMAGKVPKEYEYLHTSGHATESELIKVCNIIKPGVIIPIHKEKSGDFGKLDLPYPIETLKDRQVFNVSTMVSE